jgi:protoporphyrinogen oxidase
MGSDIVLGILGGGVSGLSLAYLYQGPSEILEKEERVGGHSLSHEKDGFRYDEGGHILFSRDAKVLQELLRLLGDNSQRHYRNNKIWYKGRFVKYPFENGLGDLDKEDIFECLFHYIHNESPEPTNFQEWVYHTFGKGIAERYLIPYNEKIWKIPLDQMPSDWTGARVPRPPVEDVIKSALGIATEGYTHQLYFYYPQRGGFEALPRALAQAASGKCRIRTNFCVKAIRRDGTRWIVSDGSDALEYDQLVSTMPIHEFIKTLPDVPEKVVEAVQQLRYNPSIFVLIGLEDCLAKDQTAVYFPQSNILFHRVCFLHSFAPDSVPPGKYSALAEISCAGEDDTWRSPDETIIQRVINDLAQQGFIKPSDVITTDIRRVRYSYVVYDRNHRRNVDLIQSYVRSLGIELLGRMAQFEYWNTDQCFAEAKKPAEKLNQVRRALTSFDIQQASR